MAVQASQSIMPTGNPSRLNRSTLHPYDKRQAVSAEQPWVNSRFHVNDSDIEVRSADDFVFQLHRVLLEVNTGAFPGSEIDTNGEIVQLTEPANVLAILFAFIYPKTHPDLEREGFSMVAAVAEAAGKYEVFCAVNTCNARLAKFLPQHAPEILVHAIKHDYAKLMNEAVPHFARSDFISVLRKLPPSYMVPWSQYHAAWSSVFKEAVQYIKSLSPSSDSSSYHRCHDRSYDSSRICTTCRCSLFTLISDLEGIDTVSALHDALQSLMTKYPALTCCSPVSSGYSTYKNDCSHIHALRKFCLEKIEMIPAFVTFLGLKA